MPKMKCYEWLFNTTIEVGSFYEAAY